VLCCGLADRPVLHRWSARLIVILSSIHVGGRIYVNVPNSNPSPSRPGYGYIRWGWVGYVAFILLTFAATRQLRNFHYTVRASFPAPRLLRRPSKSRTSRSSPSP